VGKRGKFRQEETDEINQVKWSMVIVHTRRGSANKLRRPAICLVPYDLALSHSPT